jgi:hypothetical protein
MIRGGGRLGGYNFGTRRRGVLRTQDRTLLPSLMRVASRIFLRFDFALAKDARRGKPPL